MLTMKQPHMALFLVPTLVGKTYLALDLLEKEYFNQFNFLIIICTMLKHNETYKSQRLFETNPEVIPIEPGNCLYDWIERVGNCLAGFKILFLIDDIIPNETLDKQSNLA